MLFSLSVRQIVELKSFQDTLIKNIPVYFTSDDITNEIYSSHYNPLESMYVLLLLYYIPIVYYQPNDKFIQLSEYKNTRKWLRVLFIIFSVIFTKNIDNAI